MTKILRSFTEFPSNKQTVLFNDGTVECTLSMRNFIIKEYAKTDKAGLLDFILNNFELKQK